MEKLSCTHPSLITLEAPWPAELGLWKLPVESADSTPCGQGSFLSFFTTQQTGISSAHHRGASMCSPVFPKLVRNQKGNQLVPQGKAKIQTERERAEKWKGRGPHLRGQWGQVCGEGDIWVEIGRVEETTLTCREQESRRMVQQALSPSDSTHLTCLRSMQEASVAGTMRVAGEGRRPGAMAKGNGAFGPQSPSALLPFRLEPCKGWTG